MDARTPDGRAVPNCIADGQPVVTTPIHEIRFPPRALKKEGFDQGRLVMVRDAFLNRYLDIAPLMSRQAQQTVINLIRDGHYYLFPFSREDPTAHIIYKDSLCANRQFSKNHVITIPRENTSSIRFYVKYITEGHYVFFYFHYGFHDSLRHFRTACAQRGVVPGYQIPGNNHYVPRPAQIPMVETRIDDLTTAVGAVQDAVPGAVYTDEVIENDIDTLAERQAATKMRLDTLLRNQQLMARVMLQALASQNPTAAELAELATIADMTI